MKNPLRKRYKRELRDDFGKYIAIFLFLVLFIGIVSGFLVSDNSVYASYVESFTKYNVEDGHMAFSLPLPDTLRAQIEQANDLTFYPLYYKNETLKSAQDDAKKTVRIYAPRNEVNRVCLMQGSMPTAAGEIAVDRMFAENNHIAIGDTLTFSAGRYTVTGLVALPDYSCLYENNSDMMFSAVNFGVGITTEAGFAALGDAHLQYNYAWKYHTAYKDDAEQNDRAQNMIDSLEDILKAYDETILQSKIDAVWDDAMTLSDDLQAQFQTAAEAIEKKVAKASETAVQKALASVPQEDMLHLLVQKSGMTEEAFAEKLMEDAELTTAQKLRLARDARTKSEEEVLAEALEMAGKTQDDLVQMALDAAGLTEEQAAEMLLDEYCKTHRTSVEALVAAELGTTEAALKAMQTAFDDAQTLMDDMDTDRKTPPKIDLDALEENENADTGLNFSFDEVYTILDRIDDAKVYDTAAIRRTIAEIETLTDLHLDDSEFVGVEDFIPRYQNMAITFTGDDMGSDKASITLMSYIVIGIIAFVFAVTTSNTITKEAGAIGTLRASGYSRGELVRHYLVLPIIITCIAAIVGNVLGYTVFESLFVKVYYANYSLVTYETLPNAEAFIQTTATPLVLMFVINLFVLVRKLRVRPLDFLRGQTSIRSRKHAIRLTPKLPFFRRFRLRILFQNAGAYVVLFVGILFGGFLAVFSMMFGPLLQSYTQLVQESMLAEYQTIVTSDSVETANPDAEKFCLTTLDTTEKGFVKDEVMIYGVEDSSRYIHADIPQGEVFVSNSILEKFGYDVGDAFTLKEQYSNKTYTFRISGEYRYDAALAVFIPRGDYLDTFDKKETYFTGYFSGTELSDLAEDDVAATIALQDLTKVVDQMEVSMLGFMEYFMYFGIVIFLLLMFLLTKQVIEKNSASIAMTKILGFKTSEIGRLYLVGTSVAVLVSLLVSVPLISVALRWAFQYYMYKKISGYIPYIISNTCYVKLILMGMASYLVVAAGMLFKIRKVPMGEALKKQNL